MNPTAIRVALLCLWTIKAPMMPKNTLEQVLYWISFGIFALVLILAPIEERNRAPKEALGPEEKPKEPEEHAVQKELSERMDFSRCTSCRISTVSLFKVEFCENPNLVHGVHRYTKVIPPLCGECLNRTMENQIGIDFADHLGIERKQ
jgi:hypothetical protein